MYFSRCLWVAVPLAGIVGAQYFPPTPEGMTVVKSKFNDEVKITYKEVQSIDSIANQAKPPR